MHTFSHGTVDPVLFQALHILIVCILFPDFACHPYGRMEKQETETDTESVDGHRKRKRPLPNQYFAQ